MTTSADWPADFDHLASRYPFYSLSDPTRFEPRLAALLDAPGTAPPRIDPAGVLEVVATATLVGADLAAHRERFPAMLDADAFELAR